MNTFSRRALIINAVIFLLAATPLYAFLGLGGGDEKLEIYVTNELGADLRPMGEENEELAAYRLEKMNETLGELKEKESDALFVDLGNSLALPDLAAETTYSAPGPSLLIDHDFHAANVGPTDLIVMDARKFFEDYDREDDALALCSFMRRTGNKSYLARPFIDADSPIGRVRIMGASPINHQHVNRNFPKRYVNFKPEKDIREAMKADPKPEMTILLSRLSSEENEKLARSVPELDLIIAAGTESELSPELTGTTWIARAPQDSSLGEIELRWDDDEKKITELKWEPMKPYEPDSGGVLSFLKKQKPVPEYDPPLPIIGEFVENPNFPKTVKIAWDNYEYRRVNAYPFRDEVQNKHVYYYEYKKDGLVTGRAFFLQHRLGRKRPDYFGMVTVDPLGRLLYAEFSMPVMIAGRSLPMTRYFNRFSGRKWNEIHFDSEGWEGVEDEVRMLFEDIQLILKIHDELIL